nr:hypothetical protein [Pseudonocardia sp. AL041005-10]
MTAVLENPTHAEPGPRRPAASSTRSARCWSSCRRRAARTWLRPPT